MYLKTIEIQGFKSFAEKTVLTFLPPKNGLNTITVVVGPNGSGKSNVSDAIRWVMGEQSMKQLRGKKSEDIIFAGSEAKGQMSMASVTMTLDNSDKRAAIEYDELVIARKIYRNGESEYSINGQPVRLLDVQLLLAKAQFGEGSYAVIGQGMIDGLLLQSTQERKAFFDEAAGIKEFQMKRHQAELRLARTKEHIAQADLLLNEISPRLKLLSRQVKKLEERQSVELRLTEMQQEYYVTLWNHHDAEGKALQTALQLHSTSLGEAQQQLQVIQTELASLAGGSSRQDIFAALQKEHTSAVSKKNAMERDRAVLLGKLQTEYAKSGNHQVGWLESKISTLQEEQKTLAAVLSDMEATLETLSHETRVLEQQVQEQTLERTTLRGTIASLESNLVHMKSEQSLFHMTGFRAVQALLSSQKEFAGMYGVVAQLGSVDNEQYTLALDVAAGGRLASVVVEDEEVAKQGVAFLRTGKFGVATFLPLSKIRPTHIPPFIFDLLKTPGVIGLAKDLLRYTEKFENIFSFVFGSTLVVQDFDTAKHIGIGRVRMVTLQGDLFETTGAVKGGYRQLKEQGISFGSGDGAYRVKEHAEEQEKEIIIKKQALLGLEEAQERMVLSLRDTQANERATKEKLHLYQEKKQVLDVELSGLEQSLAFETLSPEALNDILKDIAKQKEALDHAILLQEQDVAEKAEKIEAFNSEEEAKKQRVFALQETMQSMQEDVNILVQKKNDVQVQLAKVETKLEDLAQEIYQEMHVAVPMLLERGVMGVALEQLDQVQQDIQKLKYTLTLIGGIDDEVVEEYNQTKERHGSLELQLTDLHKAVDDLETLMEELDVVMKKRRDKAFKQIKKEFAAYFAVLFEGGKADLVEVYEAEKEPDAGIDGQEAHAPFGEESAENADAAPKKRQKKILTGIDIVACPPGKKIHHIRALSGGERTLTSIALMCAILKTNPSPFIVLDEVEAALDEANTLRIIHILKELAQASQFIIISHNKATMHAADVLYGVTMGNDGVSHLLSVKMGQEEP
ncbi:MAG: AAA family ATPase, partial [Candidatus Magasanikbacteria bacterium]|nr:AAA family ATPase [Candidatus Magasanikbacteria bacterium]